MLDGLHEKLNAYAQTDYYPFHMPGHKRNPESGSLASFYRLDITEIDGFDNLHEASGVIRQAQKRAAKLYGAEETHFLINGSTGGILSAIACVAGKGKVLLMARNCHKAVYHAAFLNRLNVRYLYPELLPEYDLAGAILPEMVRKAIILTLRERNVDPKKAAEVIAGVVVTSPTYDGICSNIREIAAIAHAYGVPLIVDEAHGAHLGFHAAYPENSVQCGADVVIQSTHKTLPSPTQTAILHVNGVLVNHDYLRRYLAIYQTSSPSYLLMAGIEEGLYVLEKEGEARLNKLLDMRKQLEEEISSCKYLRVCPDTEPSKVVISVKNTSYTGKQLYDVLRETYHLQLEMACETYALAMLSMMDTEEGIQRLTDALKKIDSQLTQEKTPDFTSVSECWSPVKKLPLYEAYMQRSYEVPLADAIGSTAAEFVNLYPPGIPLLVPGERIEEPFIRAIQERVRHGYTVQGIREGKIAILQIQF